MTFRYNGPLFAWGKEYRCGVVGDTQERTKQERKTQAGLQRAEDWHSTPVGEKIVTATQPTPPPSVGTEFQMSNPIK